MANSIANKIKNNKFILGLTIAGFTLFAIIAFVIVSFTSTVKAVVPNEGIKSGSIIDKSMLKTIDVPSNTPSGFLTDPDALIGQKLKVDVSENQLLYVNDVMTSWNDFSENGDIPDDYVVTSIKIPSEQAVGGLITAGDTVDILGVPNANWNTASKETLAQNLGNIADKSYGANGINLYWVLSNVKILETDSTLSQSDDSSISNVTNDDKASNTDGSYYIIAVSYSDLQKLRLCENYLDLWMSIAPRQNEENGPDIENMTSQSPTSVQDAQAQSIIDKIEKKDKNEDAKNNKNTKIEENNENNDENANN